jgi:hypothetical protein
MRARRGKQDVEAYPNQTVNQLGAQLAEYKPGTGKIILLGLVLILVGLSCAIGGIVSSGSNTTVYSNSSNTFEEWLLTIGGVLCLIGIIAIILAFGNRKTRAYVYEQGFVTKNNHGMKEVRWDQITHVWHKEEEIKTTMVKDPKTGVSTPTTRKTSTDVYVVQYANGTTCEVDTSYYGLSKFGPILEQTYPRYLFPRVLASYRAGNPITFGTLTVSSSGISNSNADGHTQLAWGSFNTIAIDKKKGDIVVRRGAESQLWSTISLTDTPNIAVFEALVNTIAARQ